jgi:hypothetical protein
LLSYGGDPVDLYRRAASYVDRILRGEKPGDLPVQLPTKFEMVVNRKTAKALGLEVPLSILVRAAVAMSGLNMIAARLSRGAISKSSSSHFERIIAPVHSDVEIEAAITALGRESGGGRRITYPSSDGRRKRS